MDQVSTNGLEGFKIEPGAAARYEPAGFWRRFLAVLIDGLILQLVTIPLTIGVHMVTGADFIDKPGEVNWTVVIAKQLIYFACTFVYFGWFYRNKGATPGKMVLDLRVVNSKTGENLGYGRTFYREVVGKIVSSIILCIGFIMAGFRKDKRALHDMMCGTRVFRKIG